LSALRRNKCVECFLGGFTRGGQRGVRRLSLATKANGFELSVFESEDRGSPDFVDLYEFDALDPSLEQDEADETHMFDSLEACLIVLESRWPGSCYKLVKEGMVQEEYRDFLRTR
jgi:hypothetical protein